MHWLQHNTVYFKFVLINWYLFLVSCATMTSSYEKEMNENMAFYDMPVVAPINSKPSKGSLFNTKASAGLFEDRRAYREGDILTVLLEEVTKSNRNFTSDYSKNNATDMPEPTLFGSLTSAFKALKLPLTQLDSSSRKFTGAAKNGQQNEITGQITVMVRQLLDNGSLFVRGKKQVRLGQGDEIIYVSGYVRPEDISPDNQISSLRLADAKISYTSNSDAAETTLMGWMSRFFNSKWYPL